MEPGWNRVPAAFTNDYKTSRLPFCAGIAAVNALGFGVGRQASRMPPKEFCAIRPAPPYSFEITSFSDIDAAVAASMIAATADRPTM